MKNKVKQILSVVMSVSMLSTMIPLTTYGAEFDSAESAVTVEDETPVSEDVNVSGDESTDSSATSTEDAFQSGDAEDPFSADDEDAFSAGDEQDTDVFADTPEAEDFDYVTSNASVSLTDTNMRIFHLDAGRKYFTVAQIENLIDTLNENGYNYMELAVGNDALRFLLDDMSVVVGETTYTSDQVTTGIQTGNQNYCRNNGNADTSTLSQSDMDTIISYANQKNISIIPLLNSPGHMDSIIDCMKSLGMTNVAFNGSARTIDVSNSEAVKFTTALIQKYVSYFSEKGCRIFNMGADEYANDVSNAALKGFAGLINQGKYNLFVDYVNSIASVIKNAEMVPMAFNDGIYYNYNTSGGNFDTNIAIAYWTVGWPGYSPASASSLAGKGHKIINTNDAWYYVLGNGNSTYTLSHAQKGVNGTKYSDVPGSNDPAVAGAMVCLWCDYPSASYSDDIKNNEIANVADLLKTFATNNSDLFQTKEPDKKPDNGAVEENKRTINLVVGGTATDTIKGYNYKGQTFTTDDPSIATVEVTDGKSVGDKQTGYVKASVTYDNLINEDNSRSWQRTNYYYFDGTNYYTLYAKRSSTLSWFEWVHSYTWGYGSSSSNVTNISTESRISDTSGTPQITVYSLGTTEVTEASTELKFTGVAPGTTMVTVGNVVYTINVSEKAPDNAMTSTSINLEYWITNYAVYKTANTRSEHIKAITTSTDKATTDEGIAITDIAPNEASSNFDGWKTVYYWQAMRLDSDNKQTNASGDDETANGTTLTHVRYHSGAWQYKTVDGTWHYFVSSDQLVAYYLQKTDVTKEIVTYAKDWGYSTSGTTPDTSSRKGQVALTVAVVYPDGTVSPAEGSMYADSTTIFNYWSRRDIGIVAPQNNSDYNISKITVTDGKRKKDTSANVWDTSDSITWNKTTLDSGDKWYDEREVWNKSSGTTPMVNGKTSNITWSAKNTAKLVLIYLEPIQKATNLNVKYVDDSENETTIAQYQIAMTYNQGDAKPRFDGTNGSLKQSSKVTTGTFTLDDDAYVTNSSNVNQHISKVLATVAKTQQLTDIKYLSGSYQYVFAEISADGKTLILHYDIDKTKINKQYVVDFGAKVNVPLSDLVDEDAITSVTNVEVSANATVSDDRSVITYTPVRALTGMDVVTVKITYNSGSSETRQLAFVPATTIYYEETFVEGGTGATNLETPQEKAKPGDTQIASAANYGYDSIYAKDGAMSSNGSTDIKGIPKEFTFTGTGVDIYANTSTATGTMMIYVKKDNNIINMVAVDTKMKNGSTDATAGQEVDGKNVPVATLNMGTYAKYTVVIQGVKTGKEGLKPVYFDGYRVYNTLNDDSSAATYAQDKEANPSYCELRDQVLHAINVDSVIGNKGDGTSQYAKQVAKNTLSQVYASSGITNAISAIVLSKENADGNSSVINPDPQDLLDNGPKNELYLRNGQIVTFNLNKAAQIGLKGVNGDATFTINGTQKSVSTTDMFYPVSSGTITIKNTSNNLLSITKIKAFIGSNNAPEKTVASALFAPLSEDDLVPAMIALGYELEPAKPSETPTPTKTPEKPVKLSAPKLGKVVSVNYNSVKVTWGKVKNADGYRVYMKENGKWKTLAKVDSTSYVCKGLKTGKKYTFTVTAYKKTSNGVVLSAYDKKGISGTPKLGTPVLKSVKRSGSGVIFTWNKTAGANGYLVYRKVNNGAWRAVAKVTKGTTYKDTTAKKGAKYTYTVRALRKSGTTNVYSDYNAKGISVK